MNLKQDAAEAIALQALGWLAGNDELLPVFLGASGASEADLRAGAEDPEFLGSVLDFLLMDDAWVLAFCADTGLDTSAPMAARAALPGGAQIHWT
ncbi:DUF3572 domain-containing protein [Roseovarius sp.]|uniref:DUF3572 domain-containing protein n=1 Tax=Roseovarius sp. TaxID=1486281 RepID=UPI002610D3B0|nr:DUF3572 domain-containing protein [Roseovarius sp.]MDM8166888.1 DUF3572 domain-containing protein [Roseovarius sp.]